MSMKTQALREEAQRRKDVSTTYRGNKEGGWGKGLRDVVVSTRDLQFLHAAAQGVGMQVEDLGGAVRSFDDPACLVEHRQDVALFDRCKRQGRSRLSAGPGTCRIAVTPRLTRRLICASRSYCGGFH